MSTQSRHAANGSLSGGKPDADRNFADAERCSDGSSGGGGGGGGVEGDELPRSPAADGGGSGGSAGGSAPLTFKKKKSLSARAMKLLKSSLGRSSKSSARTVLTSHTSCGEDASSCGGGFFALDDASSSFRLGGTVGGTSSAGHSSSHASGACSMHARIRYGSVDEDDDLHNDDGRGSGDDASLSPDGSSSSDSEEEERTGRPTTATDPEAVSRARSLHAQGKRCHAERRYEEAVRRHSEALDEMDSGHSADRSGCASEEDVLRARIAHDLARARYSFAAAAAVQSSASSSGRSMSTSSNVSVDEEDLRRLADEARSAGRTMHRSVASHLERRASSSARNRPEKEDSGGEGDDGSGNIAFTDLSDAAMNADLLRAAGRIRDERLFEYDSALRCYGAALALDVRALEEVDGRLAEARRRARRSRTGDDGEEKGKGEGGGSPKTLDRMREARKVLEVRVEETRRTIGRIHYKRGEFGMAMRASLG